MSIVYTLNTTQLDCYPVGDDNKTNVVYRVHWAYIGRENDKSAGFGGTTDIPFNGTTPFTEYENLTPEQLSEWVLSQWTAEELAERQSIIAEQINSISPVLPWPNNNGFPNTPF